MNFEKFSIVFSLNAPDQLKEKICDIFCFDVGDAVGVYLGLPTIWGRSKKLAALRQRELGKKIEGWK